MTKIKYPRTYHIPDSQGISSDDKMHANYQIFEGKEVVVTEKMDGENFSLYRDYLHARSLDSRSHSSRDWLYGFHASIKYMIPENIRVCGENLFAKHAIAYEDLSAYFMGFSVWEEDLCYNWEHTKFILSELGINHPEVLYEGIFSLKQIHLLIKNHDPSKVEGFVIRNKNEFKYDEFSKNVGKFVRKNHVNPNSDHWFNKEIERNGIRK